MNTQQAENLRALIRHMETNCKRILDMSRYFKSSCNTPACAFGEACMVPALQAQGLRTDKDCSRLSEDSLFGAGTMRRLFGTRSTNSWKRADVTPQEWAIEARKVLAENGYTMDTPPDPFKRFMDKVREPVSLGSYAASHR